MAKLSPDNIIPIASFRPHRKKLRDYGIPLWPKDKVIPFDRNERESVRRVRRDIDILRERGLPTAHILWMTGTIEQPLAIGGVNNTRETLSEMADFLELNPEMEPDGGYRVRKCLSSRICACGTSTWTS